MKKILLAVIIIAFTSCSKAQNPEFEEEKLSLLKEISESEEQLKTIIELAELNDTPLKLSIGRTLEPKPIELPPIKADLNKLQKEIKTLSWEQNFIDNQTIISVEEEIFDNYPNIDLKEVVLENIKFYDNKKFDQTVKSDFEYYDIEFPLDVKRKRIKSFDLKFLIESDEYLNFSINEKKSTIAALKIKDIKIKNKTITFVKEKTDDEKDFEIYVSDRDGLFYESISSSSVTKFSEEEIKYYKSLLMHFKDLKKALNNNDFANEEVFKKYSEKNQPKEVSKSEENELYNFDFSVNPKNIIFRVLGNKYTEQLIVSFSEDLDKNKFIAKSNRKYGLIDVNGKWIIEPTDDYLSENETFPGYYNKGFYETIWVSPNNKKIVNYDFSIDTTMIVKKTFKIAEAVTTSGYGLFDANNNKMILPIDKETSIKVNRFYYFVKKRNENKTYLEGLYNLKGNKTFGLENQEIEICANNLVVITKNKKELLYKLDTVSNKPKLLTSRAYANIDAPHYSVTIKELNINPFFRADKSDDTASDYLNIEGEIIIDGEKYNRVIKSFDRFIVEDKIGVFSILDKFGNVIKKLDKNLSLSLFGHGDYLLILKNETTGLFGFVNREGALVIPIMYSSVTGFYRPDNESPLQANVTTVDKDGNRTNYFIDINNNLIGKK